MAKLGETKIENNQTGFKLAASVGGRGTGERGDRVVLDDPTTSSKWKARSSGKRRSAASANQCRIASTLPCSWSACSLALSLQHG
jgi:hypothetical protein